MYPSPADRVAAVLADYLRGGGPRDSLARTLCASLADALDRQAQPLSYSAAIGGNVVELAARRDPAVRDLVSALVAVLGDAGEPQAAAASFDPPPASDPLSTRLGGLAIGVSRATVPRRTPAYSRSPVSAPAVIFFAAACPEGTSPLQVGQEQREIGQALKAAELRDRFVFHARMSVRPRDFMQALAELRPQFVHFSGHGDTDGILFEDDLEGMTVASPGALRAVFETVKGEVECVLLNACYAEIQARAIAEHVPFVIGMRGEVTDAAAIAFSIGFYQALGAGRDVRQSFEMGWGLVQLMDLAKGIQPVLVERGA
jgi:hypothetical protein